MTFGIAHCGIIHTRGGMTSITRLGSTLYIGMNEALAHYACTLKKIIFELSFSAVIHF